MKPVYLLFLCLLFWQCKPSTEVPDPGSVLKSLKRITSSGVTIDFHYASNTLSGLTLTSNQTVEQIEYTRHPDGRIAAMITRRNNREAGTYTFDTDQQGRIIRLSNPYEVLFEYQYDAQGNLSAVTNKVHKVTEELTYAGNNLVAFGYKPPLPLPFPIETKAVKWDDKPNPLYELNTRAGFVFPILMEMSNAGLLHFYSPVLNRNNVLEEADYNTGKVNMKYTYEYREGLPVIRKTFKLGPDNTFTEIEFNRIVYEY